MVEVYNPIEYERLIKKNHNEFNDFNNNVEKQIHYRFNYNVLKEIATHMLLKTHDDSEILEILQEFKQLRGGFRR